jgi:hypothetical protein
VVGLTYLVARVRGDANRQLLEVALVDAGRVCINRLAHVPSAPLGHAIVMLQSGEAATTWFDRRGRGREGRSFTGG